MEDNHRLLSMISTLKIELREVHLDFESLTKYVKMLSSGSQNLEIFLKTCKSGIDKKGLRFFEQVSSHGCSTIVFVRASDDNDKIKILQFLQKPKSSIKRSLRRPPGRWICHYCGRLKHICPFCLRLHGYNPYTHRTSN